MIDCESLVTSNDVPSALSINEIVDELQIQLTVSLKPFKCSFIYTFRTKLMLSLAVLLLVGLSIQLRYSFDSSVDFKLSLYSIDIRRVILPTNISRSTLSFLDWQSQLNENNTIMDNSVAKKIPKLLFRSAEFSHINAPTAVKQILESTLTYNEEYTQVVFSELDCISFVKHYYPENVNGYDSLVPGAYRSDLFRLMFLYKFGGIYNDIGHRYLKPIDDIINEDDEFVIGLEPYHVMGQPGGLHNGFMAAYPKHFIIKSMLDLVMDNVNHRRYGVKVLDITGPYAVARAFNKIFNDTEDNYNFTFGSYEKNGYKIKTLQHDGTTFLLTYPNKEKAILTKFANYNSIMYGKRHIKPYGILWNERNIYKNQSVMV